MYTAIKVTIASQNSSYFVSTIQLPLQTGEQVPVYLYLKLF